MMRALPTVLRFAAVFLLSAGILSLAAPSPAYAAEGKSCSSSFLTFPAWYDGLVVENGGSCDIKSPSEVGGLSPFIWTIGLNIVEILLNAAGYASVAFIIYGGYKYMISAGSPDGMVSARKTIMNAVIGLVISVAAVAIIRTVTSAMGQG